jgi:GntR family transcriptional repressor for pyruvate dehydrogenase complex
MKPELQPRPMFSGRLAAPIRLADTISDAIAEALFDGRIKPGDPLPSESEIAEEFAVSKPIAREALRQLSGAGLVQTQQGKVARARALSGEPLDRIYGFAVRSSLKRLQEANEMRRVVETGIARLAAQRRVVAGLEQMAAAVEAMRAALHQPDAFTEADIAFHLGLAKATGNTMIRVQVEGMRSVQSEVSELFSRRSNRTDDDWRATIERHRDIMEAVRAGDEDRAVAAIETHFKAADIASIEVAREKGEAP